MQSGNSMKKYASLFLCACVCAIGIKVFADGFGGDTPSPMSLIINGNSTGTPIQTGDTVSLAFPTASTRTEISKSDYDTYAKEHIGRSSFFYSETVNGQIHYYRYDVNFAYMAVDGTMIVDKSHADASALWRVMTQAGDATHARRYQHLQTGKWLKCEITNGQVVWELVDDVAHSSLITHQWTTVLDYQKDARTFAYPIILNGTEAFYIYFDQQAAKWTYSKDVTGIVIDPMYCEKWSEHKSLSLELDALLPAGTNYFAFTQGDAGTQECQITIWPKLADSTYIHSVPGKRLNYDNLHINEVVTIEDNINTLKGQGYSFGVNWRFFGGDILNQPSLNEPSTTYIPFSNSDVTQIENSTYKAGAYNAVTTQTTSYQDTPREMMKAELSKNGDTKWIITVTPQGWSPLNWWVKGIDWADFTDLVKMTVTKDGKTVATREFPMIRESRHYLQEETLESFITPTQHTFSATGGTLTVKLDSVIESHHIDLYDTKGYLVPSYTTIIQSTKLIPGTAAYNQKVERQVSLQKEGSTDKPEWLNITGLTDAEITIQCGQNEGANSRLGILHSAYTNTTTGQIYAVETRLFQDGRHTAGDIKFDPQGGWGYTTLGSDGRQKVHTTETTIYYHDGEEVELRLRERNFFGYMRWYDYHTGADPKFYTASDGTMKTHPNFWNRAPLKYKSPSSSSGEVFDPINTDANTSHGLYFAMRDVQFWFYYIYDAVLGDNDTEYYLTLPYPRLLVPIVKGWNPDKSGYPTYRDIACDVSNYTDYKEAWQTGTTDNVFREPTLSYRHIFHLRPAKEMADTLAKCIDGKYFEDYTYAAPIKKEILLQTRYAHAYPVNSNRPSDLCYYFYIKKNNKRGMVRLNYKEKRRVVLYVDGKSTPLTYSPNSDYISVNSAKTGTVTYELKIENSSIGGGTIDGGKPICLARWTITYVDPSECGPSSTELISRNEIAKNYIILAEKDFNYNKPGTKDMVLYDKPLNAEESSFGFCYPYSKANGNSQRGTDGGTKTELDKNDPFPYYGEYAIVNAVGTNSPKGNNRSDWLKPTEQRGGAENGYCLYVDGSQRPGKVVTLSTNTKICSGQQLYCSAWICNPANSNKGASPIFRFDVEGRNPGGKWEAAGSFYTGEIGLDYGGKWLQIRFPVVSVHDYEESRITIYNYAATNSGNDFLVDDVMLYATRLPLGAYQATTSCKRGALNDSLVTMIKVDYTLLTEGYAGKTLYYRIYNQTGKTPVVTNYYNNKNATYGWIQMPTANYKPTDEEKCSSVSQFAAEMSGYTNDTVCVKYIWTEDMNHRRWVMYIAQLVNGSLLDSKKDYEVQTAYAENDLDHASCAMRTKLPVYEKTAHTFNGETYPTTGHCANDLYRIEILVTDQVDVDGKLTEMKAYAKGDWLKGYPFDDIWYDAYTGTDTIGKRKAADEAFEDFYGYTRWKIEDAIRDMRRESTTEKPNPNFDATDVSQLKSEPKYWDNTEHYQIIYNLCQRGLLTLAKERQVLYMHSNDTVRYWVYPIANTAKATYDSKEYILNICTEPTYIKVFTQKSDYDLNLSNKTYDELTGTDIPRARISLSAANSRFGIPIKEIGNDVALCYDSTQVVQSTDPNIQASIGKPNFSMHYTEDKMYQDYPGNRYYKAGDTIWFTPIDAAHVQAMKERNRTESKWTDGHPGLWVPNTHSMRTGYEYTLRVQMMTRSNQALDAADGCLIGYSPITVVVVPDTMIWAPTIADTQGHYSWADDRNWRGVVDGKTLTWGYTPISETMVILPTGLDKEKYPYIPEDKGDNILYPLDVNYHTNVCKKVQFRENALMLGQENLKYEQAYVDMVMPANAFYTISAPLQGMYSGDLYVPHNGRIGESTKTTMLESNKDFEVSGFQGTRDSLAGYAFWAMYYNQDVYKMYNSGEGSIVSTTASFLQSNKLDMPIAPGKGIAAAGFGPTGNETDITVRLPKPDTKYHYYTNTGAVSGQSVTVDRTHSYKLAYTPGTSGDMEVTLTVKNEVNAGTVGFDNNTTGFLFGNPTMAYIDMFKLMDANPNVLSHVGYQVMTGDKYTTVLRAAGTTDHYLAPMQSAIVLPLSKTNNIKLKIPSNCLVLNPYAPTGSVQPAPRRTMGHTFRSDRMDIMVYSDGGKGSAILLARDFADNAYNVEEDMLYNAAGFGADKNRLQTMTPVNVYTLAGNMPLAADVREKIGVVPLGFEIDNAYRQDSIDIFFSLNSVWSEECYFCDSETGERWRIYNDTHIRIAPPPTTKYATTYKASTTRPRTPTHPPKNPTPPSTATPRP